MLEVSWSIDHPDLLVGIVEAHGVTISDSDDALRAQLESLVAMRSASWPPDDVKKGIRDLLRRGGYKPAGRGKPASEYLAGAAARGDFPLINNVVDINNLVSLETGWPISSLDLDLALGDASSLEIRFGEPLESYVFNQAGQVIDVNGLLGIGRVDGLLVGTPVKDSLAAKTVAETRRIVSVIYTSRAVADEGAVARATQRFGDLLARHAGADDVHSRLLPDSATAAENV